MASFNRTYEDIEIPAQFDADILAEFYCHFVKLLNQKHEKTGYDDEWLITCYDEPHGMLDEVFQIIKKRDNEIEELKEENYELEYQKDEFEDTIDEQDKEIASLKQEIEQLKAQLKNQEQ